MYHDRSFVQDIPALPVDSRIWIVDPDVDLTHLGIYKSLGTRDLRMVPIGTRLQGRNTTAPASSSGEMPSAR